MSKENDPTDTPTSSNALIRESSVEVANSGPSTICQSIENLINDVTLQKDWTVTTVINNFHQLASKLTCQQSENRDNNGNEEQSQNDLTEYQRIERETYRVLGQLKDVDDIFKKIRKL